MGCWALFEQSRVHSGVFLSLSLLLQTSELIVLILWLKFFDLGMVWEILLCAVKGGPVCLGSAELRVVIIDSKAGNRGCKTEILCKELVEMLGGNRDFMQGISWDVVREYFKWVHLKIFTRDLPIQIRVSNYMLPNKKDLGEKRRKGVVTND